MAKAALHLLRFDEGTPHQISYPLKEVPQFATSLHSPRVGKAHDVAPFDYRKYEEYLTEVENVRLLVGKGEYPHAFLEKHYPKSWGRYTGVMPEVLQMAGADQADPSSCANIVRMDTPADLGIFIQRWLLAKGALKPKKASTHVDFIENVPGAQKGLTEYNLEVIEKAFEIKYYYGVARPSQVYEYLGKGKRSDLMQYPNPTHPSYCAGHAALAGSTAKYFYDNFQLDTQDWIEIRNAAYLFAQYRTLGGVHFAVDNMTGLQLCLLYTSPSPRDQRGSRMPSSA